MRFSKQKNTKKGQSKEESANKGIICSNGNPHLQVENGLKLLPSPTN